LSRKNTPKAGVNGPFTKWHYRIGRRRFSGSGTGRTLLRRWTRKEDRTLAVRRRETNKVLAAALGRTQRAVENRLVRLGLQRFKRSRRYDSEFPIAYEIWDACEVAWLRRHKDADPVALSIDLGRSPQAILEMCRKLGIRRKWYKTRAARRREARRTLADRVRRLRESGLKNWQVAERLGLEPEVASALYREARKARHPGIKPVRAHGTKSARLLETP
jgi:hypothetical protein